MKIKAFAPGKVILFGEHTVVYGKPAIAVAIDRGVDVVLESRCDDVVTVSVLNIGYYDEFKLTDKSVDSMIDSGNKRITDYIYKVIGLFEFDCGFDLTVDIKMHLGAGLGSSAAVTVATLKAISVYLNEDFSREVIAGMARGVEVSIQGAASPVDTAMSTYGGIIYIDRNSEIIPVDFSMNLPLLVSDCGLTGNTGEVVACVRRKYEKHPEIMEHIFSAVEEIAVRARKALEDGDEVTVAELMNINQGLLDAMGVNTAELSRMVYDSRRFGSKAAKLTGSGGGGCIISYTPDDIDHVYCKLNSLYDTFRCEQSDSGVYAQIIEK